MSAPRKRERPAATGRIAGTSRTDAARIALDESERNAERVIAALSRSGYLVEGGDDGWLVCKLVVVKRWCADPQALEAFARLVRVT